MKQLAICVTHVIPYLIQTKFDPHYSPVDIKKPLFSPNSIRMSVVTLDTLQSLYTDQTDTLSTDRNLHTGESSSAEDVSEVQCVNQHDHMDSSPTLQASNDILTAQHVSGNERVSDKGLWCCHFLHLMCLMQKTVEDSRQQIVRSPVVEQSLDNESFPSTLDTNIESGQQSLDAESFPSILGTNTKSGHHIPMYGTAAATSLKHSLCNSKSSDLGLNLCEGLSEVCDNQHNHVDSSPILQASHKPHCIENAWTSFRTHRKWPKIER